MQVSRLATLVFAVAVVGCGGGGDDGGTTGPPPPPPPTNTQTLGSITTNVSTINIAAGGTQAITVTALDTQGAVISNAGTPTFAVAPAGIATVDGSGVVVGVATGSAVVTVSLTRGGVTRTATVNVTVSGSLPGIANVSTASGDVFSPSSVTIARGGSVTWTFGATVHNVTFQGGVGAPANIPDRSGTTESRTFSTVGDFSYNCTLHAGMNGQVIVR